MQLLSTAASGLESQTAQLNAISNNIANLNTTGYQRADVSFADMLTQVYGQSPAVTAIQGVGGRQTPAGLSLGTGQYALPLQRYFDPGKYQTTSNPMDMAIHGDGFFMVGTGKGQVGYTRAGNFQALSDSKTGHMYLATASGDPVLNNSGQAIDLTNVNVQTLAVSSTGQLSANSMAGNPVSLGTIGLAYVGSPTSALRSAGADVFNLNTGFQVATNAPGSANSPQLFGSVQGSNLEMSNVNLTQEMTNMIQVQHSFTMDAQAVNIADKMMGLADTIR